MTLEEINNLTLLQCVDVVLRRLIDFDETWEGQQVYWILEEGIDDYDRIVLNDVYEKPSRLEFNAALDAYKAELTEAENIRLAEIARRDGLKARWNALLDKNAAFYSIFNNIPNREKWFKDALVEMNEADLEDTMLLIEQKDFELDLEREVKKQLKEERKNKIKTLKENTSNIDNSELPEWHKELLKLLVDELKE